MGMMLRRHRERHEPETTDVREGPFLHPEDAALQAGTPEPEPEPEPEE